jgi:fermentation-respiration switch protein FrsA (DUF1100 family)
MTRRLAAVALALALGLVLAGVVLGEVLTRPVRAAVGDPPPDLRAEAVRLSWGDGQQLAGWFVPGEAGQGAVLLLHGVRGNRLQMLARARWLQQQGIASLLVDLPAHGESSGERIGLGRLEAPAVDAALAWLRARLAGERLGAIGVSLGGASLLFARREPALDVVVLESVYPTINDALRNRLALRLGTPTAQALTPLLLAQVPWRLGYGADQLRPVEAIRSANAPVLVASGSLDAQTPWLETETLFAAARDPKALWRVDGAAHVDLHAHAPADYEARIGPWLQAHLRRTPP